MFEVKDNTVHDMETFISMKDAVLKQMKHVIVGKDELVRDMFTALLAEGNIQLEGIPGVAKTSIAKAFASAIGLEFKRIQFVPDLLPSDIIGAYIFQRNSTSFELHKGPIFTNILLADEINRASPKVQSALLEAMEEKQVSIEGTSLQLPRPFMVITTQNPIEVMGTFPLPEAQIDRFMFKLNVEYPTAGEELEMLKLKDSETELPVNKVLTQKDVLSMIQMVKQVYVDEKAMKYIRDIVLASRSHEKVLLGGSPRASISFLKASKAIAALGGRDFVTPDDIKLIAAKVLNHRLIIKPEYELENVTSASVIDDLLKTVPVPV